MNKKLEDLFSDSAAFDEGEIVEALDPHITIQRGTNIIYLKNDKLAAWLKIGAYALAKQLLHSKSLVPSKALTSIEFRDTTGMKKGTFDPALSTLKTGGYFIGENEYEIPHHMISKLIAELRKAVNKDKKK